MKRFKNNKSKFIIVRVTVDEKQSAIKQAKDSKNLSSWARRKLGFKNE